jgi:hypothetical protein
MYKLVTMNPLCVDAIETMNANAVCKNDECNEKIQGKRKLCGIVTILSPATGEMMIDHCLRMSDITYNSHRSTI